MLVRKNPSLVLITLFILGQLQVLGAESILSKLKGIVSSSSNNGTQLIDQDSNNQTLDKQRQDEFPRPLDINRGYKNNGEQTKYQDTRIPFWNIAHMINSIDQIDQALSNGSNGIEVDVSFDKSGAPIESYHGFPCDCGRHCHYREDFVNLIKYIAKISVPPASSNLQLVLFDLKLKELDDKQKEYAGQTIARILQENLYSKYARVYKSQNGYTNEDGSILRPPLRVVISINHVTDQGLVRSFMGYIKKNRLESMSKLVGFDIGMNDKLVNISSMWTELNGLTNNIWQGDGLTNCANLVRGIERLKEAIQMRNEQGYFRKVYYWTVDILYQMRSVLRLGVDAVLTNQPQRVLQVLEEPEFRDRYRLATHYDDPFAQYWIEPSAWKMSIPSMEEAKETIENIKKTSESFIKGIPDGLSAAVKKVQASISQRS